jgi:hypothetical protein
LVAQGTKSVYVWASNADSCKLWRIVSKLNVKVIGRKELNHFHLEQGLRQFPEDYPESQAFYKLREEEIKKNFEQYLKFPRPKRPNYLALNSPSPFASIVPEKSMPIELEIVSRGHCTKYAYIC